MTVLPVRTRRRLMRHPYGWVASGFGAGFSPWAPGTVGTAVALVPWWYWGHALQFWQYAVVLLAAFLVGTVAAGWVIRDVGVDDPSLVVWDEFVGVWLALWTLPREWPWLPPSRRRRLHWVWCQEKRCLCWSDFARLETRY